MKTIVCDQNCSKYLVADDYSVVVSAEHTEMGDPSNLDFIIGDLNSTNSTIHTGVTSPADWQGGKYTFDGTDWAGTVGWVDPKVAEIARLQAEIDALNA
jgi:hypothetical protein